MNDREQARAELAAKLRATPITARRSSWLQTVDAVLAHPDLVLRALGMERRHDWLNGDGTFGAQVWTTEDPPSGVWVEPPTDQESQESRKQG